MKPKAVIFGAGLAGQRTFTYYRNQFKIVAFADNDPKKAGATLMGLPVVSGDRILEVDFEKVIIGSTYSSEITQQLLGMGLSPEQIGWVGNDILEGLYTKIGSVRLVLKILGLAAAVALVYFVGSLLL